MTQASTIILIAYAITMLSYGALEMGHDLLHYLDAHSHVHVHHHARSDDHSFNDHHHHHSHDEVYAHTHTPEPTSAELPSLVSLFLYTQTPAGHTFIRQILERLAPGRTDIPPSIHSLPSTPPPQWLAFKSRRDGTCAYTDASL